MARAACLEKARRRLDPLGYTAPMCFMILTQCQRLSGGTGAKEATSLWERGDSRAVRAPPT